jgi:hypothetical protein
LINQLTRLTLDCWRLFRLTGYARVDFRVDKLGQPWILEINTNPCISPDAGFAAALEQAGIGYDAGIQEILNSAISRHTGKQYSAPDDQPASRDAKSALIQSRQVTHGRIRL